MFSRGLLACDEMSEAIWQDKCRSMVTNSLVNDARAISDELRGRCGIDVRGNFRSEFELLGSGHQFLQKRGRIFVDVDAIPAEAIAAGAAHGGINRRHAPPVLDVQL